jgi:hypothetical protein
MEVSDRNTREAEKARTKGLASNAQLWRLNALGLIELRDRPAAPLLRTVAKECIAEAARRGMFQSSVRGARGPVRSA